MGTFDLANSYVLHGSGVNLTPFRTPRKPIFRRRRLRCRILL
jgi:hypothetical protein